MGNVHFDLARKLVIPGVLGGVIGAYLLTNLDTPWLKPVVAVYLAIMGLIIIYRAFRALSPRAGALVADAAGLVGRLHGRGGRRRLGAGRDLDAGGPRQRTPLHGRLGQPDRVLRHDGPIGDLLLALGSGEFLKYGKIILGLLIGGAVAAPLAAFAAKHLPHKPFMLLVGILIVVLNVRTLILTL